MPKISPLDNVTLHHEQVKQDKWYMLSLALITKSVAKIPSPHREHLLTNILLSRREGGGERRERE